ncbi:MAG: hypothetical protein AB7G28_14735 [Pirellulales bacterium]
MRARPFAIALILMSVCGATFAHGPQMQVTLDNNKITTRRILDDDYTSAGVTPATSVYVIPVLPVSFVGQPVARVKPVNNQTFGPGLAYGIDQLDGGARDFTAPFSLHVAGLQIWDGTSFVATGAEQLGLLASSSNVNPDSTKTTAAGTDLAVGVSATYTATAHSSIRYTVLGDGVDPYSASRDGVYLATLQLSGTQSPAITPSDPYYFVLNKNASPETLSDAIASLGVAPGLIQVVPEPAAALLALCGLTFGMGVFRAGRQRSER